MDTSLALVIILAIQAASFLLVLAWPIKNVPRGTLLKTLEKLA
jgi:hypothetical protein